MEGEGEGEKGGMSGPIVAMEEEMRRAQLNTHQCTSSGALGAERKRGLQPVSLLGGVRHRLPLLREQSSLLRYRSMGVVCPHDGAPLAAVD